MRRWSILILAAGALAPRPAPALTFLELLTGAESVVPDARTFAMGRTRVGGTGAFSAATNPAYLPRVEHPLLAFAGGDNRLEESRSIPAFDSFDGFLVESTYAFNREHYQAGGIGVAAALAGDWVPEWLPGGIGLGATYAPVRDYRYSYSEEVRDNNSFTQPRDRLLALNGVASDGQLRAFTVGLGVAPTPWPWIGGGVSLELQRGEQDLLHRTVFFDPDSTAQSTVALRSLGGERWSLGISAHPSHHVEVAASWRLKADLAGDYEQTGNPSDFDYLGQPRPLPASGSLTITYPHELAFGVTYHPRAKMRTTVRLEAGWTGWSDYVHGLWGGLDLDDVWDGRIGLEHVFYNGFAARFGFSYRPSPQRTEIVTTGFTFGGGLARGPVQADVGFEIGNRRYRFEDLFPDSDFGGIDRTEKDTIEESTFGVFLTLSLTLDGLRG